MYLTHYGLREEPFGDTPDPRFLYLTAGHREALASLSDGIETGHGFQALIAAPGMGKTTLLFQLLQKLEAPARNVFLFQTQCDSREFVRYVLADLGVGTNEQDLFHLHKELNEVVTSELRAGRKFVMVIDEAHNLEDAVLETIRHLSNLEAPGEKLMQIILSGQPQLSDRLARPDLERLRQRITTVSRIEPLRPAEIRDYVNHRLRVAGYQEEPLFTPGAMEAIASASGGIPRKINILCFNALSLAYGLNQRRVDRAVMQEVIADLNVVSIIRGSDDPVPDSVARSPRPARSVASSPAVVYLSMPRWLPSMPRWRTWFLAPAALVLAVLCALVWSYRAPREFVSLGRADAVSSPQKATDGHPQAAKPKAHGAKRASAPPAVPKPYSSEPQPDESSNADNASEASPVSGASSSPRDQSPAPPASTVKSALTSEPPQSPSPPDEAAAEKRASALRERGDADMDSGDYDKAIHEYQAALDLDPFNTHLLDKLHNAIQAKATENQVLQ